jgi:hypothetical protein
MKWLLRKKCVPAYKPAGYASRWLDRPKDDLFHYITFNHEQHYAWRLGEAAEALRDDYVR